MIREFRAHLAAHPTALAREAVGLAGLVVTILAALFLPVLV
jgi:hypothetical protein